MTIRRVGRLTYWRIIWPTMNGIGRTLLGWSTRPRGDYLKRPPYRNRMKLSDAYWHDPLKLDRFGCECFLLLIDETTHKAQGKQSASPLKTIDAVTNGGRPIVAWAIKHPMSLRKT